MVNLQIDIIQRQLLDHHPDWGMIEAQFKGERYGLVSLKVEIVQRPASGQSGRLWHRGPNRHFE